MGKNKKKQGAKGKSEQVKYSNEVSIGTDATEVSYQQPVQS